MFTFKGRDIKKIAVVGSGQIGPDIALYFAKVFAPHGVPVVVVDVVQGALDKGQAKVTRKIDKGVETGAFKPALAEAMKDNLRFTTDYQSAADASLVVEAASEDKTIKGKIFAELERLCVPDTIFASNSSHMEPEVIFEEVDARGRTLVVHYFFPAERNPIVEVVPGRDTRADVTEWVMALYQWMGKVPLLVKSRYGYAIDPVFEGLFQAAALCVEEGLGTTKEVDAVAASALGLGVGPFTAMNLTGGNPITHHGLSEMHDKIMPYFQTPALLSEAVETGAQWEVPGRGVKVEVDDERRDRITRRMRGAYLGLACEILDSGIVSLADLELGLELGLVIRPPFKMMNAIGVTEALALVEEYAGARVGFKVAGVLKEQAATGKPWKIPVILREDRDGVAVLTIRRPAVLNAMNAEAIEELREQFEELRDDASIRAVVLTGYGKKAFVSGADIGFLARLETQEAAENMCLTFQGAINVIESFPKPVVCALNGIAFGGGCEIAMGCHARVAPKNARVLASQPEVNLGIIPGAGGTQRLPRIVGYETANVLLRTGRPISGEEALEIGLVDELADGDVVEAALALANRIAADEVKPTPINAGPIDTPDELPAVELGHLSRAVDAILCRTILDGGRRSLCDGLKLEAKAFAEVCQTEDKEIGIRNFIEKGPRSKAAFVHR